MSTRSRSQDLTADLLHDIAEDRAEPVGGLASSPSASAALDDEAGESPFVETALFLAPRAWSRPRIARSGVTVSLSAGPLRMRVGRR